jgi:hypothetical protein
MKFLRSKIRKLERKICFDIAFELYFVMLSSAKHPCAALAGILHFVQDDSVSSHYFGKITVSMT